MALQKCKDCSGQVSNLAAECLHCGRPQSPAATSRAMELIKSIPIAIGVLTLIFAVVQYKKGQDWHKAEFIAAEMRDFESSLEVREAKRMIGWDGLEIKLFPAKPSKEVYVEVTNQMVVSALRPPPSGPYHTTPFSIDEAQIKEYFNTFFDGLERFGHFAQAGLVNKADLAPYWDRWISVLGDTTREKSRALRTYIHCYGYYGVEHLVDLWDFESTASIPCP